MMNQPKLDLKTCACVTQGVISASMKGITLIPKEQATFKRFAK